MYRPANGTRMWVRRRSSGSSLARRRVNADQTSRHSRDRLYRACCPTRRRVSASMGANSGHRALLLGQLVQQLERAEVLVGATHLDPAVAPRPSMTSRPASVRTRVSVQSLNAPMPPVEMSACSAAKSGHILQPSRVNAALLERDLVVVAVVHPDLQAPLMFIFLISAFFRPYFASSNSSKMASSNVFEHSSPMLSAIRRATLPALRCFMTGGTEPGSSCRPARCARLPPRPRRRTPACWPSTCSGCRRRR